MATSNNAEIQDLMNQVDALDSNDDNMEEKLQIIAAAVAAQQQKDRQSGSSFSAVNGPVDPQDDFACDGCQ